MVEHVEIMEHPKSWGVVLKQSSQSVAMSSDNDVWMSKLPQQYTNLIQWQNLLLHTGPGFQAEGEGCLAACPGGKALQWATAD